MNDNISISDKIIIYFSTSIKVVRGFLTSIFLKSSRGLLFVGKGTSISHKKHISVGKNVKFEDYAEVHGLASHGLIFGNNVTIGKFTSIRPSSYYGVGNIGYGLEMGDNSSIGPYGFIGCSGKISIGNNVMVGPRVSMFAENHNFADKSESIKSQGVSNKGITIEDNCWIGSGVIILDGVTIGSGSVIGAGTLVTKDVPRNSVIYDKRSREVRKR